MKKYTKIMVVEDEKILRVTLTDDLKEAGYNVQSFSAPLAALAELKKNSFDIVITDIKMPQFDGIELLGKIKKLYPDVCVILMTAFGSIDSAVDSMKKGAYDYITKPFKIEELLLIINRINELQAVKNENTMLKSKLKTDYTFDSYISNSVRGKEILSLAKTISNEPTTVLITGETGTGKDLLANVIHYNSDRGSKPLIKVSCAVFSREIFESELFGHEKGAFTGALQDRVGRFEMADKGAVYLDDIDDIPLDLQVKLLRVIEEQEFERLGGNKPMKVDIRFIASTKVDLKQLVKEGKFREDLYYRLNIFPIQTLPLRERKEDLTMLINNFIKKIAPGKNISISDEAIDCMKNYDWFGNVRELRNIVERMILVCKENKIVKSDVPVEISCNNEMIRNIALGDKPLDVIMA
ncbi:MAG: sigma-54 dependent transcriptional regulator, partial [Candidatus Kapabacteria bacterium]|nr:sigma-54 dependent transcriptional regulator [Candidatus Kapabacteria bacterium]